MKKTPIQLAFRIIPFIILLTALFTLNSCSSRYSISGWDQSKIKIARDSFGVPHIFGQKDADVAYGLAWAHSEDNFETIQKTVLAGKAMAGRVFGKEGAKVDFFANLLQVQTLADEKYDTAYSPEFKRVIEGYAAGLNDYALTHPEEVLLNDAFPVTTKDITSAYILSLAVMSGADRAVQQIVDEKVNVLAKEEPTRGSNAFAIHSSRTETNENFLVSNSHQALEGPEAWYEAHLNSEEGWNIIGSLFPGGAMIFHGVNENLGWAHTVNSPDLLDIYQLELNDEDKNQYKVDGEWLKLEERRIWLKIKIGNIMTIPVTKKIWNSIYGPTLVTEQGAFAIRVGALDRIGAPEQWWRMNKAKNFSEFKAAMKKMQLTSFNVLYADRFDTIFYVSNALLPKRTPGCNYRDAVPGNSRQTMWTQYHPFSDLPQQINPSSGYLYNTNHSPFKASALADNLDSADYPAEMNFTKRENNRSIRFREIMPDSGKINYDQLKKLKYDGQLPKILAYRTNMNALFNLDTARYPDISRQISALKRWDKTTGISSQGAAVFSFQYHYWRDVFRRENRDISTILSEMEAVEGLREAKSHFLTHFKKEIVTLGEYQKLVRGNRSLPIWGIDDVLTTIRSQPWKNGMRRATQGESYIMMVRFGDGLPKIETINVYGASNKKDNQHYDDQMELFLEQKLKPMTLDKKEVLRNAKRIYSPAEGLQNISSK